MSPSKPRDVHTSRRARRDPDAVRERLYRVSLRRIRDQGYEAASVAGITREADVAKGTFFNYFPTKEHVLARYLDEALNRILARAVASGGGTDAIARALDDMGLELTGDPELARAVIPRLGLGGLPGPPSAALPSSPSGVSPSAPRRETRPQSDPQSDPQSESKPQASATERISRWIRDRLSESLRLSVPMVEADDEMLVALLLGAFEVTLREWCHTRDAEPPFPRERLHARIAYLIETAGFPRPPSP